jgi:valyl-tRNA synthetase
MLLPKRYYPNSVEPRLQELWETERTFSLDVAADRPIYLINTPLPTVSGRPHLGHVYPYSHPDVSLSIHRSPWPQLNSGLIDESLASFGECLVDIATAGRRYKSNHNLPLSAPIFRLQLSTEQPNLIPFLHRAEADLQSITRAQKIEFIKQPVSGEMEFTENEHVSIEMQM